MSEGKIIAGGGGGFETGLMKNLRKCTFVRYQSALLIIYLFEP